MDVCVYGAGAVGGHIAGRLTAAGQAEVSVVARGEQLAAIRRDGLRVETADGALLSHPAATDRPDTLPPQDVVVVAVKAPALPEIAEAVSSLLRRDGLAVFVTNGVPWWYFSRHGGALEGHHLPGLDPGRRLAEHVTPEQVVGAVAYTAGSVVSPGVVRADNPRNRLVLGRPDGTVDEPLTALGSVLTSSGLSAEVTPRIRDAVWAKLLMNVVGGALAVLSASPMRDVLDKPAIATAAETMVAETAAVARALRCDPGDPSAGVRRLSASGHLQSIAQDLLAGRAMEVEAMFRAPLELARLAQVETPVLDLVLDLATQRARAAGGYRES